MKKLTILMTSLLVTVVLAQPVAAAIDPPKVTNDSTVQITFEGGEGPTKPVDPEEPGTEGPGPEVPGSLAIVHASNLTFPTGKVSLTKQYYETTTVNPNVQVVDLRGTNAGWALTAEVSGFVEVGEGANVPSLPGAIIRIKKGRPNSTLMTSENDLTLAPTIQSGIELTPDDTEISIAEAESPKGKGLWVLRFYPAAGEITVADPVYGESYIVLEVPGNSATVGNHTATITWTLTNSVSDS